MFVRFLQLVLVATLSACATQYDHLRNYAGADAGYAIASIGMSADNTMNYSHVYFRRKGSEDLGVFEFSPKAIVGGTGRDFQTPRGDAVHVVKRLPPGDYEIYDYAAGADYGTSMVWYKSRAKFSIPFSIKSEEVVYLGQYLVGLETLSTDNHKVPVAANLEVSDESQRDMAWRTASPLRGAKIINAIASMPDRISPGVYLVR